MKTVLKPLCMCMYVDEKIIDSKETVVSLALQRYDAACQLSFLSIQFIRNVAFLYVEEYRIKRKNVKPFIIIWYHRFSITRDTIVDVKF